MFQPLASRTYRRIARQRQVFPSRSLLLFLRGVPLLIPITSMSSLHLLGAPPLIPPARRPITMSQFGELAVPITEGHQKAEGDVLDSGRSLSQGTAPRLQTDRVLGYRQLVQGQVKVSSRREVFGSHKNSFLQDHHAPVTFSLSAFVFGSAQKITLNKCHFTFILHLHFLSPSLLVSSLCFLGS